MCSSYFVKCVSDLIRWDLKGFREEIVVAEGHESVKWVLGVSTQVPTSRVDVAWLDPNGTEISSLRHSLIVDESAVDKSKVSFIWIPPVT